MNLDELIDDVYDQMQDLINLDSSYLEPSAEEHSIGFSTYKYTMFYLSHIGYNRLKRLCKDNLSSIGMTDMLDIFTELEAQDLYEAVDNLTELINDKFTKNLNE